MTNGTLFLISALWAEPCFQFCKGTGVEGKEDRGSPFLYPWLGQRCSITPQGLEKHEKGNECSHSCSTSAPSRPLAWQQGRLPGQAHKHRPGSGSSVFTGCFCQSRAEQIPSFTLLWIQLWVGASPAALLPLTAALLGAGFGDLVCFQTMGL